jgi:GntR family transcriptional regulator/MocR family aminotransferase
VAYAFSPIDLIPDFIPVLGYLDDIILVPLGALAVRAMIPSSVLAECRARTDTALRQGRPFSRLGAAITIVIWLILAGCRVPPGQAVLPALGLRRVRADLVALDGWAVMARTMGPLFPLSRPTGRGSSMAKRRAVVAIGTLGLERASSVPLYRQLYDALRDAILSGRLRPGSRLPSTRALADDLGASRNTVLAAFGQLLAEGYLEGRVGAGTTVARTLPETLLRARPEAEGSKQPGRRPRLSRRGAQLLGTRGGVATAAIAAQPFRPGLPGLDAFPFDLWTRLVARRWRRVPRQLLDYGDPAGYAPLREAIATYLGEARAVRCEASQVIVVTGAQQAVDLAARILLDPGDTAWVEDPGYQGARGALVAAGIRLAPVPVDAEGLDVRRGARTAPGARLVYVTPSHQYPLGVTMSLNRRLALLEWASASGAWILEDDYDSEYRYAGRPLAALQGLDAAGRVIYAGTFSKVLFPALRLGYLVVPPELVDAFIAARALADRHSPSVTQAALADFIDGGHFARHVRRTRALYAERQAVLVRAARRTLGGLLEVAPAEAGMHLMGWLPAGVDDRAAARAALARAVDVPPLSAYRARPTRLADRGGLMLGYAAYPPREIDEACGRLALALESVRPGVD